MSESLEIEFIDVYSPDGSGPINQWISAVMNDEEPETDDTIYHWVHIRDAEFAQRVLEENNVEGCYDGGDCCDQSMIGELERATETS